MKRGDLLKTANDVNFNESRVNDTLFEKSAFQNYRMSKHFQEGVCYQKAPTKNKHNHTHDGNKRKIKDPETQNDFDAAYHSLATKLNEELETGGS